MKCPLNPPLCFLLLVVGLQSGGALSAEPADGERIQAQLESLTEELNNLDSWLSMAGQRRLRLQRDLRAKDRAVAKAGAAVDSSDVAMAEIQTQLVRLDEEGEGLRTRQTLEARHIGEHLAAAYRLDGQDLVRLLLDLESPATVERMLVYHRHLIEARLDALESYREAAVRIERNAEALAARQATERAERQRLIARKQELERNRQQRHALIAALEKDVEDHRSRREVLLRNQERLEALFAELQTRSSELDGKGFADRKGALPWPLDGTLVSRFGQPRADGRLKWQGILLRADPGSPVRAVYRGQVVFADWLRGFGLLTILDHGGGYMSLYGHADRLAKRPGDMVESGEVIAQAGQSGGIAASGLYFEIRRDGNATDPLRWVAGRS